MRPGGATGLQLQVEREGGREAGPAVPPLGPSPPRPVMSPVLKTKLGKRVQPSAVSLPARGAPARPARGAGACGRRRQVSRGGTGAQPGRGRRGPCPAGSCSAGETPAAAVPCRAPVSQGSPLCRKPRFLRGVRRRRARRGWAGLAPGSRHGTRPVPEGSGGPAGWLGRGARAALDPRSARRQAGRGQGGWLEAAGRPAAGWCSPRSAGCGANARTAMEPTPPWGRSWRGERQLRAEPATVVTPPTRGMFPKGGAQKCW